MKIFTRRIRSVEQTDALKSTRILLEYINTMQDDIERAMTKLEKAIEALEDAASGS